MRKRRNKNNKLIRFHNSYLIVAFCFVLTGYYLNLIVFTSLIIVHEFGHYLTAKVLKFNVSEIVIYPYGGILKLDDLINRDINEELIIAVSGIIMQYFFYLFIVFLYNNSLLRGYTFNLYTIYNSRLIFFNLLPIIPLDGSKIVNLLLSKVFNYDYANKISVFISVIVLVLLVILNIYRFNFSNIMVYFVILGYIYDFFAKRNYMYNRFLLERYLYDINYKDIRVINNYKKMYKNKSHLIYEDEKYLKEKEYLKKFFRE